MKDCENESFEQDDVEMRETGANRNAEDSPPNQYLKKSLMQRFYEADDEPPKLQNFINFDESDEEPANNSDNKSPFFNISNIVNKDAVKQNLVKKISPQLYATRQFSFCQAFNNEENQDNVGLDDQNEVVYQKIAEEVSCKKNLFANENEDPNSGNKVFQSPKNRNGMPLNSFLDNDAFGSKSKKRTNRSPDEKYEPQSQTIIEKWKRGNIMFKGKYSSGVTPKIERQIVKGLKIKSNKKRKLFEDESMSEESGTPKNEGEDIEEIKQRRNPFLQITPQMNRKIRKCSFEANESMELDFSSPPRNKKVSETPAPNKTYGQVPMFDIYDSPEDQNQTPFKMFKDLHDRGARFNEDFIEICNLGKGNFGSVVKCQNKLDGIEYAIKITEKQHPKKRLNMYEALQEAYALAALSVSSENPYIVRYYRGWIENEQLYIQMELCETSLYHEFKQKLLGEKKVLQVLRDI